jgi:site-specific DNA-cytosine methylase
MYSALYSCQILITLQFSRQIFEEALNIKFHENPSSRSRVVPCGRTDGQTDMSKVTIPFRNCANTPKYHALNLKHISRFYKKRVSQKLAGSLPLHQLSDTPREVWKDRYTYSSTLPNLGSLDVSDSPSHGSSLTQGEKQRSSGSHRQKNGWTPKFGLNAGKRRLSTPAVNQTHIFQSLRP